MNGDNENCFGQMYAWIMNDRRLPYDLRVGLVRYANTAIFRNNGSFIKTDFRHKVSYYYKLKRNSLVLAMV